MTSPAPAVTGIESITRQDPHSKQATKRINFYSMSCRWEVAFIGAALLVVCGHLLIKAGLNSAAPTLFNAAFSTKLVHIMRERLVLLGLGIYGLGTLCWMAAVAQSELSLLYPLTSLNYILIAVFSYLLFQESISLRRGSGIAIIALGVILLARSQPRQKKPR